MELLRSWCNDELKLSRPVRNIEADFRDGYLLGEILSKHGLLDDLQEMRRGDGPHTMLKNYNRLQPALRKLNINLDTRVANQMMVEKPGVATNIVYQLKLAVDSAGKAMGTNLPPRKAKTDLSQTTLSTTRQLRAPHEEMRQRTFDAQLRMQMNDPRELRMSQHLSKYTEAMYEQTRRALEEQQEVRSRAPVCARRVRPRASARAAADGRGARAARARAERIRPSHARAPRAPRPRARARRAGRGA